MDIDNILMGVHPASIDSGNGTTLPAKFRRNLEAVMGKHYYLLISKNIIDESKILTFEPILKDVYNALVDTFETSELECLSGKVISEVRKNGKVALTAPFVKFLNSQKGDNYYFVGCGEYCELYKSEKSYTEFYNRI